MTSLIIFQVCLSNCEDQRFSVSLTQASYPNTHSFVHTEEFQWIYNKILKSCNGNRRPRLNQVYPILCETLESYQQNTDNKTVRLLKNLDPLNLTRFFRLWKN